MITILTKYRLGSHKKPSSWITVLVLTLFVVGFALVSEAHLDPTLTYQKVSPHKLVKS